MCCSTVSSSDLAQSEALVLATSSSGGADVCDASTGTLCIISFPTPWLSELKINYDSDPKLKVILQVVQLGSNSSHSIMGCYFTKVDCIWVTLIRI